MRWEENQAAHGERQSSKVFWMIWNDHFENSKIKSVKWEHPLIKVTY